MSPRRIMLLMRRNLTGEIEKPRWPLVVSVSSITKETAQAGHAVLEAGYYEGGGGAPKFRRWWKELRKNPEFDPALCFLASDMEGVCGICECWRNAYIKDLAVHPRMRRIGIGRALMLTAFNALKTRRALYADLRVREENAAAQRLYRSLGMFEVAREPE